MRVLVLPYRRWLDDHWRRALVIGSILISLVLALFLAVPPAHADSPFNDPAYQRPVGGGTVGSAESAGSPASAALPTIPAGYRELPPPPLTVARTRANTVTALAPLQQQAPDTNPNNPLAWISLGLNPGKWLLDSVLGATTGIIYSLASIFEVLGRFGNGQVVDISGSINAASDTAFNMLFTTPENLTISWPGAPPKRRA